MTMVWLALPASAQFLDDHPATIRITQDVTELQGSVPPRYRVPRPPGFHDPKTGKLGPSLIAEMNTHLHPGVVIDRVELFARRPGTVTWSRCQRTEVEDDPYRACLKAPLHHGRPRICIKQQREFCGEMRDVEFQLGRGNFGCHNSGPDARLVRVVLNHRSASEGFEFRALIWHKHCPQG